MKFLEYFYNKILVFADSIKPVLNKIVYAVELMQKHKHLVQCGVTLFQETAGENSCLLLFFHITTKLENCNNIFEKAI